MQTVLSNVVIVTGALSLASVNEGLHGVKGAAISTPEPILTVKVVITNLGSILGGEGTNGMCAPRGTRKFGHTRNKTYISHS